MVEGERKKGHEIPGTVLFPSFLYYSEVVKFSEQIQRYFQLFPRKQIKIIVFDDFVNDMIRVFKEVLEFLEVEPIF